MFLFLHLMGGFFNKFAFVDFLIIIITLYFLQLFWKCTVSVSFTATEMWLLIAIEASSISYLNQNTIFNIFWNHALHGLYNRTSLIIAHFSVTVEKAITLNKKFNTQSVRFQCRIEYRWTVPVDFDNIKQMRAITKRDHIEQHLLCMAN